MVLLGEKRITRQRLRPNNFQLTIPEMENIRFLLHCSQVRSAVKWCPIVILWRASLLVSENRRK